jgi:adenosylcobinamide-GDP ribazoletransferase
MNTQRRPLIEAPRFTPLWGVLNGAVGAGVYWISAQLWPASIAVIVSMLATHLFSARMDPGATVDGTAPTPDRVLLGRVFAVLVKYNALMALSAASLPFALPANLALGLIMIAGHAASRALLVSVLAAPTSLAAPTPAPSSHTDLGIALGIGFAPAVLLGIPGLVGLVAALAARFAVIAYLRRGRPCIAVRELDITRQVIEVCFYLGALAAWAYA